MQGNEVRRQEVVAVAAAEIEHDIRDVLTAGGCRRLIAITDPALPKQAPLSSITRYPFLIINLRGAISFRAVHDGETKDFRLNPYEGVFFAPTAWCAVETRESLNYLRITFEDETVYAGFCSADKTRIKHDSPWDLRMVRTSEPINEFGRTLLENVTGNGPKLHGESLSTVNVLLAETCRHLHENRPAVGGKSFQTFQGLRTYTDEHFREGITRQEVAAAFRLSPSHVSRLFSNFANQTFNDYVDKRKILEAKQLLQISSMNNTQVAHHCGFRDLNYFSRVFKKKTGVTPSAWRRQHRARI